MRTSSGSGNMVAGRMIYRTFYGLLHDEFYISMAQ